MPVYSTEAVARGSLVLKVTANGTVQPTRTINIGSELSGTVLKVNVDVNDRVKKGQVLVVLDTAKLQRPGEALAGRAGLGPGQGGADHGNHRRSTVPAWAGWRRWSGSAVARCPRPAELDTARATLARAQRRRRHAARAGVQDARAALSTDQTNLGKASIVAPADGVVLTRSVDPGNAVAASLQAVTLFTIAEDLAQAAGCGCMWTRPTWAMCSWGSRPASPWPRTRGATSRRRISRVGFGSTITENVVTYLTYLDVDNPDQRRCARA